MGATQSRTAHTKVQPEETSKELVSNFMVELLVKGYPLANKGQLHAFGEQLLAKYPALEDCRAAINHFRNLAEKKDAYVLFNRAMFISLQTEQNWLLNENSLNFFSLLRATNIDVYDALMVQLTALCKTNKLFLRGNHLDTVIASLNQQQALPARALEYIAPFLKDSAVDYKATLQRLRLAYGPELDIRAKASQKLHHAAPHALEIRERTMLMLQILGVFPESDADSAFLKDIISFMIEFHDEEQINKGSSMSVEEATVEHIIGWLNKALALDTRPQLKELLVFIANRVIVLGTTMIFSPIQTVDLSDLYLLIEDSAIQAEMAVIDPSNRVLNKITTAAMLMTGICDKNPAALPAVVNNQASDARTATHSLLSKYLKAPLLIDQFFNHASFSPYFKDTGPCAAIDYQAFFITFTPHLSMRTELSAKAKPELAHALITFVADCREKRSTLSDSEFVTWYESEFTKRYMAMVVKELFFTAIPSEVSFSRSQLDGLKSAHTRLKQYKLIAEADTTLVDIHVPERDALNLIAFDNFYKGLDNEKQKNLLQEMVLAVVVQAGAIYVKQPEKGYDFAAGVPEVPVAYAGAGRSSRYLSGLCHFTPSVGVAGPKKEEAEFKMRY